MLPTASFASAVKAGRSSERRAPSRSPATRSRYTAACRHTSLEPTWERAADPTPSATASSRSSPLSGPPIRVTHSAS